MGRVRCVCELAGPNDCDRFNHAWRKTTTLSYTRFLSQCCAAFQGSSVPSDILINPLIKANELLSRVNEHFSYFDIDNAEIRGDIILEMSTSSFLAELDRIRESIAFDQTLKSNSEYLKPLENTML